MRVETVRILAEFIFAVCILFRTDVANRLRPTDAIVNALSGALSYSWPPFVLVIGLLLIGRAAAADDFFEAAGSRLASVPGGSVTLFVSMMALVALVTVVLNLDTSIVFLTPILLHAARRRGIEDRPFLYGVIYMSNAASLLLPGSNLTNLLVISNEHVAGVRFALAMLPAWTLVVATTTVVIALWCRSELRATSSERIELIHLRLGPGIIGIVAATLLVLILPSPSLFVFGAGATVCIAQSAMHRLHLRGALRGVHLEVLTLLFTIAVAAGVAARVWNDPHRLMTSVGRWATAGIGAGAANLVNNLPATVLFASQRPSHPEALLLGLDIGPNLAVFGAMSSLLWLRIARAEGAKPSALTFSMVGVVLVPLSLAIALIATGWVALAHF